MECTHTSDWWKNMVSCVCCGAMYSDEEADRISSQTYASYREFSKEQEQFIAEHERSVNEDF